MLLFRHVERTKIGPRGFADRDAHEPIKIKNPSLRKSRRLGHPKVKIFQSPGHPSIGEGIGSVAAHEIAHQLVNSFGASGKIVSSMDLDDASTNTYNGIGCSGSSQPWVYTGSNSGIP